MIIVLCDAYDDIVVDIGNFTFHESHNTMEVAKKLGEAKGQHICWRMIKEDT